MSLPRFVALCGWPKSGKDEVAHSLRRHFEYSSIDDGKCLREAAPALFGCDPADPFSQEGKAKVYDTIQGKQSVRWMLGEMGNALETHFGEGFMPFRAMQEADALYKKGHKRFVFPSVRKTQPFYYKQRGALVIEVRRPGAEDSGYEFDRWDSSLVDMVVHNDSTLAALDRCVRETFFDMDRLGDRPKTIFSSDFS